MLGRLDETDAAVQEAWLRLSRTDESAIENFGAWLTTVVGRVCLDECPAALAEEVEQLARAADDHGSSLPVPVHSNAALGCEALGEEVVDYVAAVRSLPRAASAAHRSPTKPERTKVLRTDA